MADLEQKIIEDGVIKEGNILKVDNFLNHQMPVSPQTGASVQLPGIVAYKWKREESLSASLPQTQRTMK